MSVMVTYRHGGAMASLLAQQLREEGLDVTQPTPIEERGAGHVAQDVVLWVAEGTIKAGAGALLWPRIRKVIDKHKERRPNAVIEVEESDE